MKTILIIGASSGIGKELALQLADSGHQVVGTYHRHSITSTHSNLRYMAYDVMGETPLQDMPEKIDALIYCPGSILLKPFARIRPDDFVQDYQLNVIGAVKVIQSILPALKLALQANIVFLSSVAATLGLNYHSVVASSKGALEGLTRALAAEFAPTIRVNAIALSLTDTPLASGLLNTEQKIEANAQRHPMKRIGNTSDVTHMISFILSDQASWITGQIFHVDGGMSSLKI